MPGDIFNRNVDIGKSFKADEATLTFSNSGAGVADALSDLLVQNLTANYTQQITRLWDLGTDRVSMIAGRTSGTIQLSKVIGPSQNSDSFLQTYSDVCKVNENTITFKLSATASGNCPQTNDGFEATGCVIEGLTYSANSQNVVVTQQVNMQIISLKPIGGNAA